MDELKEDKVIAIFAISTLLVSVTGSNFGFNAYADDSSENDDREEKQSEKELKEQHKEKIDDQKQLKNELRDEYKIKLEEKKKQFVNFEKELKEKYNTLKNEFKEKYQQLRISKISELKEDTSDNVKSSLSDDEKIELEIKRKELLLLEHEFRENIKNLKLEAKEQFNELKYELKIQDDDRKNKIRDRINELKEKYKDKIREHDNHDSADLESYPSDYGGKKINVCHFPPGNSGNAHTINISFNAWEAHRAHDDYWGECDPDQTDETDEEGRNIKIELKEEIGFYSKAN
ncbi:MAG: hypothetical protein XU09_C0004G0080 [Thaumarchaeota archaeon CSP1-1]|nr:MAG: hypothetical protein XU09_C0004G0080 [Thaumarchaeota archaeon CSP1-1]